MIEMVEFDIVNFRGDYKKYCRYLKLRNKQKDKEIERLRFKLKDCQEFINTITGDNG